MNAGTPLRLVALVVTLAICTTGVHGQFTDVVFVIDSSWSISIVTGEWNYAINFFRDLIPFYPMSAGARFGAVTFGTTATIRFYLDDYTTPAEVDAALAALPRSGGATNIADGLAKGFEVFLDSYRPNTARILFLFTDGHDNVDVPLAEPYSEFIQGLGIGMVCVGIDNGGTNEARLMALCSDSTWVQIVPSFAELVFYVDKAVELIRRAIPGVDQCSRCKDYNEDNYGYVAAITNDSTCYWYYVCRRDPDMGVSKKVHIMQCPIGTQFAHFGAIRGNPCVAKDELNREPCVDHRTPEVVPIILTCPYKRSTNDPSEFGFPGGFGKQSCGAGGYFDDTDGVCTCTIKTSDCHCLIWIDFTGDFHSHSCHGGSVRNSVPPVRLIDDGIFGQGGEFTGLMRRRRNGAHLTTRVIDGIFSPTCDGQFGQHELTVALWFNDQYNGGAANKTSGLVNYCDGPDGPAFFIEIRENRVCAGLKTLNHIRVDLCSRTTILKNHWYYTALVYKDPFLYLYVTDVDDYVSCSFKSPLIPGPTCPPAAIANQTGCVESRTCGFDVGVTGRSWKDNQFFTGLMDEVQVSRKARYHACR